MGKVARVVTCALGPVLIGAILPAAASGSPATVVDRPAPRPPRVATPYGSDRAATGGSVSPAPTPILTPAPTGAVPRTPGATPTGRAGATAPGAAPPVVYRGGSVMGTTGAGVTVHGLYWSAPGYAFPVGFARTMNGFLDDAADGSGQSDNVLHVITQYYQQVNGVVSHITGDVRSVASVDDGDAYPAGPGGCVPDAGVGFTACVTNAQLGAELASFLTRHRLPGGFADQYSVFFPPGVETCSTSLNSSQGGTCSSGTARGAFCAFHSWTTGAVPIVYADLPWIGYCSDSPRTYPDGATAATADVTFVVHELTESMTDPNWGGWHDAGGNEVADECMGDIVAQPFGSTWWDVQTVFSDAAFAADPTTGCVSSLGPRPAPPQPLHARVVGMTARPDGAGYWVVDAAGGVSPHGDAAYFGSMAGFPLNAPISHIVATADGRGYWLVASDGGIFSFGDAPFFGSMGALRLNAPVVDIAPTADGGGYWLVASDGGVFAFGDAGFSGSMGGMRLNRPVVGIASDAATGGYWLVASDGGIFAFGAPFFGSTGAMRLNQPIVSMASACRGTGYWFVASDGGVFAFHAPFQGSMGTTVLNSPMVGMAGDPATAGYWMVASDGGVFAFGAPFNGSD